MKMGYFILISEWNGAEWPLNPIQKGIDASRIPPKDF
jgi:hypothetical protein